MTPDLDAISAEFLNQCGPCDFAMPGACECSQADYRPPLSELVSEVSRLRSLEAVYRAVFGELEAGVFLGDLDEVRAKRIVADLNRRVAEAGEGR